MALSVVGFEGEWPDDAAVAWGAAAVRDLGRIVNSFTGLGVSEDELDSLEKSGGVTTIGEDLELPEGQSASGLVVVAFRVTSPWARFFRGEPSGLALIVKPKQARNRRFYVFADMAGFQDYVKEVVADVMRRVTADANPDREDFRELIQNTLVLSASDPSLHAYRIAYSSNPDRARSIAYSLVRSEAGRETLNTLRPNREPLRERSPAAAAAPPQPLAYAGGPIGPNAQR